MVRGAQNKTNGRSFPTKDRTGKKATGIGLMLINKLEPAAYNRQGTGGTIRSRVVKGRMVRED